jgi:hypothetical protein
MVPTKSYLECEYQLSSSDQALLRVEGKEYSGKPLFDPATTKKLLEALPQTLEYGDLLFQSAFPKNDDLYAGFKAALAIARHEEKRLRFRLNLLPAAPSELNTIEWEALYNNAERLGLSRSREVSFSRYVSLPVKPRAEGADRPRILVVVAAPSDLRTYGLDPIDYDLTCRQIKVALEPLISTLDVDVLPGSTRSAIRQALIARNYNILHIHAHGFLNADKAALVLTKEDGSADFTDDSLLAEVIDGIESLRLVVLMACRGAVQLGGDQYRGLGASLVRRGIPAVVAMRSAVTMDTASNFVSDFYSSLAYSADIDTATNEARHQLYLRQPQSNDFVAPVLFMRLQNGRLWTTRPFPRAALGTAFDFVPVMTWLRRREVIPILGPGINRGLLLSRSEIAERWAIDVDYPGDHSDLAAVANFRETIRGRKIPHANLFDMLKEDLLSREDIRERRRYESYSIPQIMEGIAIKYFERDNEEPHRVLAELPIDTYVTTNWDGLMTAALQWAKRSPKVWTARWINSQEETRDYANMRGQPNSPLVFNLFGNDIQSAVLTEDDHLDFLKNMSKEDWRFPKFLKKDLTQAMLVFLGFDFRELDFKVMFRTIVDQLRQLDDGRDKIAVIQVRTEGSLLEQKARDMALQAFVEGTAGKLSLKVFDGTVREFLAEVRLQWRQEHGEQLQEASAAG